jgi:hypothetical protein
VLLLPCQAGLTLLAFCMSLSASRSFSPMFLFIVLLFCAADGCCCGYAGVDGRREVFVDSQPIVWGWFELW